MNSDRLPNKQVSSQEVLEDDPQGKEVDAQTSQPAIIPQGDLKPGLYLVATPIGNLRDITFRALDTLSSVDLIVCEDTRVTGKLLKAYGFKKPMWFYNDHSADSQRENIIKAVQNGQAVAILSDAGTPLVSDPGYKLVRRAIESDLFVTSIPGPSAALSGMQLSGLPTNQFSFLGFLPPKSAGRVKALQEWSEAPGSLIVYETGPRLEESLRDMAQVLGNRDAAITRELTKIYEEVRRGSLEGLADYYASNGAPKGEIVVVVAPRGEVQVSGESLEAQIHKALETMSVRDAAEMVSKATGKPKRAIYTLALKLSSK
ncbi:MAG: 16S rRNA (cytidine(1402)-2'-O)-methyltransferase [Alphaproteobacteria bacterium]|nr:16S rRNA (cytidine(1402)-2'-O)-methyltransferase [Alphaproteobacteria bacterium]